MAHNPLYCTYQQIKSEVGTKELGETSPTTDVYGVASPAFPTLTIDQVEIETKIDRMCDLIDSYIGETYTVPITGTVPGLIVEICLPLTIAKIYKDENSIPEGVETARLEAIQMLKDIQNGELKVHGLAAASSGVTVIQPYEAEEQGQYDDEFNKGAGKAFHMGQYD